MTQATHSSSHPSQDAQGKFVLSYARANKAEAQRVFADLEHAGISCWMDWHDLLVGRDWELSVRDAIRGSRGLLLIATPESAQSTNVHNELSMAWANDLPIYPLWLAGERYETCIHPDYKKLHARDLRGDDYATELAHMIAILTGQEPARSAADFANAPPRNPYKGLQAFRYEDRDLYFGRRGFVADLVNKLRAQPASARLLAVIGASGSGKSSAVMAGLLPALRAGNLDGSASWVYLDPITPTAQPLEQLAIVLSKALPARSTAAIAEDLAHRSCRGLHRLAAQVATPGQRVVLIVDQFEELFTLCRDVQEREQFLNLITLAATEPNSPLQVVLTLRADFTDKALAHAALCALLQSGTAYVPPLSLADLVDAIKRPAELPGVGLRFDEGLVNEIAFDVTDRTGALPLLQFALDELYRRREGNTLTRAAYEGMGRMKGALAQRADEIYRALAPAQQAICQRVLLELVQLGEGSEDTRRRVNLNDVFSGATNEAGRDLVNRLAHERLLTLDSDKQGQPTLEVAHEALIQHWSRLREWLDANRDDLSILRKLRRDAQDWDKGDAHQDRPSEMLYQGGKLDLALACSNRCGDKLNQLDRTFLNKSKWHSRFNKIKRTAGVAVVITTLAWFAISFYSVYDSTYRKEMIRQLAPLFIEQTLSVDALSKKLAAQASFIADYDSQLSMLLAIESYSRSIVDRTVSRRALLFSLEKHMSHESETERNSSLMRANSLLDEFDPSWRTYFCSFVKRNLTWWEFREYVIEKDQTYRQTCELIPAHSSISDAVLVSNTIKLLESATVLRQHGKLIEAETAYRKSVNVVTQTFDPDQNNIVCWYGSIDGYAKVVLPACERAVELASYKPNIRDSRGVAYAIVGRTKESIDDLQYFLAYGPLSYEAHRQRVDWIKALTEGKNPFLPSVLEDLRKQDEQK